MGFSFCLGRLEKKQSSPPPPSPSTILGDSRLTAFENRSTTVGMEIRVFVPPARPDQYRRIIRLKPGETKELVTKSLCYENTDPENPTFFMLFMDGVYTGIFLLPLHVVTYAKIICDTHDDGQVNVRGIQVGIPGLRRLRGFSFCLGRGFRSINPRVVHHIGASASVWGGVPVPEQGLRRSNSSINPRAVHHLDCSGSVYLKEGSPTLNKALKL
uniref:Uncharacterized protein n=1 Tax=Davidia involucrata TaxID=16924 RepID=A0A5B7AIR0_DAVIN